MMIVTLPPFLEAQRRTFWRLAVNGAREAGLGAVVLDLRPSEHAVGQHVQLAAAYVASSHTLALLTDWDAARLHAVERAFADLDPTAEYLLIVRVHGGGLVAPLPLQAPGGAPDTAA